MPEWLFGVDIYIWCGFVIKFDLAILCFLRKGQNMAGGKKSGNRKSPQADPFQIGEIVAVHRRQLLDAPYNPRKISADAEQRLRASMEKGDAGVVVWNKRTGRIVGGHQRIHVKDSLLATDDYTTNVLAIDVDETEEKHLNVRLNNPELQGEFDMEKLNALFHEPEFSYEEAGFEPMDLEAMYVEADMDLNLLTDIGPEFVGRKNVVQDEVPEPPKVPVTRPGDLWLLGKHRLLCGDSTKPDDVARVMNGQKAGLMNTDPPYGVKLNLKANHEASNSAKGINKKYREFADIENDELDGELLQKFLEAAIRAACPHLNKNAAFYLWHPMLTQGTFFAAAAAAADILIHRQIIWVKPHFIFGRGDYHWKHELCFYGWVRGFRPPWYGERNQDTVWTLDEGGGSIRKDQGHPTQKPVALFIAPIENHTKIGEVIYEPFSGSGSQFVAAEQLNRRCCGLEIEPAYVDVAIARHFALTNIPAILESTGQTFSEVSQKRLKSTKRKRNSGSLLALDGSSVSGNNAAVEEAPNQQESQNGRATGTGSGQSARHRKGRNRKSGQAHISESVTDAAENAEHDGLPQAQDDPHSRTGSSPVQA